MNEPLSDREQRAIRNIAESTGKYDDHTEHMRVLTNWQQAHNEYLSALLAGKQVIGPLPPPTRWYRAKRRIAGRWSRIRCRNCPLDCT